MSTKIRAELSEKNKYWISRHRYYELKHFCLQYSEWKRAYRSISLLKSQTINSDKISSYKIGDPTAKYAITLEHYSSCIKMVEQAALESDNSLKNYILKGITEGVSYDYLKTKMNMPCSKDTYYDRYRKFFWILSKLRD